MRPVRIGSGAGYAGDRIEPALELIQKGNIDYIIFECLAERTIALAQREKLENPKRGYNPLLEYRMEQVIPLLKEHPVKVITNMGAANPGAAADKIYEIACRCGLPDLRIAAVEGDDVLHGIENYFRLPVLETGEQLSGLSDSIISANAYIGGQKITAALAGGADVVVTGRVADPCLVAGPLMYAYDKPYDDWSFLGKAIVAGHLLECGGQVSGGYFCDPGRKDVPELWNLGFPIMEFSAEGEMKLEKLPDSGGLLNEATVKEQLLYEIQDPAAYLTPDVVADFSSITVERRPDGRIQVHGAAGKPKTGTLKVSVGYHDGYIGEGEISYGGRNAVARAQLAEEIVRKRLELRRFACRELRIDLMGMNSLWGDATPLAANPQEVRLRVAARADSAEAAAVIGQEVEALYTNGPAGGGGARSYIRKVVSVASVLIPETDVTPYITWRGGEGK